MDIPNLVKQIVLSVDPDAEVILFGSRARGDFHEESDWDFLILLERQLSPELKDYIINELYEIELETDSVISSLIHNKVEWEAKAVMPIHQIIEQEGVRA